MKIAFIADGRSNNFRRWVRYFVAEGDDVYLLSTYNCDPLEKVKLFILPTPLRVGNAFVKQSSSSLEQPKKTNNYPSLLKIKLMKVMFSLWEQWNFLKLVNLPFQTFESKRKLNQIKPDLVIAFRTQNEGYIAALTTVACPKVLFTQGSDFIYMANRHKIQAWLTGITVKIINALLSDCNRDIQLAKHYGFPADKPAKIFPGNGGVNLSVFEPGLAANRRKRWIVYPRGLTPYMKIDTFLESVLALQQLPDYQDVQYTLLATQSAIPVVELMTRKKGIDMTMITIEPFLSQSKLVSLLQQAAAIVSPSLTDGIPNTMLEAMACGAFPIMSGLESIREWINHGENGFLFDPNQADELTTCLKLALDNIELRQQAQTKNLEIIRQRADCKITMPVMRKFLFDVAMK
ncbi:glycosyltransferase family 4 protein [Moorena sp. SIO3H5]|uniref:glycosyltransferase family 4 protein n=1 Tax=Moorena sp. SIO3H5 TaxID=2607834 RepID=UPI0013B5EB8B|nr:glycosyltransferase family 4 protein [Moorena sp. SIO3H5]NEO68917.1 glycosyltransferase family 4 protein [Moorena sp. SIO3H5]